MPSSGRLIARSTAFLMLVGLAVLLGIVGTNYWLTERARGFFDSMIVARDARVAAVELRNALQSAEASQRGFLISGNEIYLAPYSVAKAAVERQAQALQQTFSTYSELAPLIQHIDAVIARKLEEMDGSIDLKRSRKDAEALELFRSNRGKALMDEANVLLAGAIRAADQKLTQLVTEHRGNALWLWWVSIAGGVIIIAVVGTAMIAIVRYTRDLARARNEVQELNQGLENRVKERTAQLADANEEIQNFAYIVTHDLRAPLVNIMGFTSELETGVRSFQALIDKSDVGKDMGDPVAREASIAVSEDLPEAIGFIRSSTRKMDALISAILKISREGRRVLRPEPVDLEEAIKGSAAAIAHQILSADGSIKVDANIGKIITDKLSLENILGNLLDNAVKYRALERPLAINVEAAAVGSDHVRLRIEDNGRGVSPKDLERIFELFRRAGSQDQPGEGIGLAYVRTLVRRLGGKIDVTSRPDEGTQFEILLPRILKLPERPAA